jgi:hypothetical protein
MRVDINRVLAMREELDAINVAPLESLEFYDGDTRIDVPTAHIEDWKLTGLSNAWFAADLAIDRRVIELESCG